MAAVDDHRQLHINGKRRPSLGEAARCVGLAGDLDAPRLGPCYYAVIHSKLVCFVQQCVLFELLGGGE